MFKHAGLSGPAENRAETEGKSKGVKTLMLRLNGLVSWAVSRKLVEMKMIGLIALYVGSRMMGAAEIRTNAPATPVRPAHDPVSEEQRAKLRETNEKFRAEQTVLYEKLRGTRREMEQAAQAEPINEASIRAKAAVIGQIEGDLALLRARHYKELRTVLPHDQAARQSGLSLSTNQYPSRLREVVRANTNKPSAAPAVPSKLPATK
jgi:hypothetical protein